MFFQSHISDILERLHEPQWFISSIACENLTCMSTEKMGESYSSVVVDETGKQHRVTTYMPLKVGSKYRIALEEQL